MSAPTPPPGGLSARRAAVAATPGVTGIERLRAWAVNDRTVRLEVQFLPGNPSVPPGLTPEGVRIYGEPPLRVQRMWKHGDQMVRMVAVAQDAPLDLEVRTSYTLELLPRKDVDPRLDEARFTLGTGTAGPPPRDASPASPAAAVAAAAAAPRPGPVRIDYLAKDYTTFRRLMLDRLAVTLPDWTERNPADMGVVLVELLAYAADYLSYLQDAAGTEAYLDTARLRTSLQRHARLLDYPVSEGCAAAAWVQLRVRLPVTVPAGTRLLSRTGTDAACLLPGSDALRVALERGPAVFETVDALEAHPSRNELGIYTWEQAQYALEPGATRATLYSGVPGAAEGLRPGDVLVLVQRTAPEGGQPDPALRKAVRLTEVRPARDPLARDLSLAEVAWDPADAPSFALPVSGWDPAGRPYADAAGALGNIVLADHGRTVPWEGWEPLPPVGYAPYRPSLGRPWVTRTPPVSPAALRRAPAAAALARDPVTALPVVQLRDGGGRTWMLDPDLLGSGPFSRDFMVETGEEGVATLRFGDGELGMRPAPGTVFHARYRVGFGPDGNLGAGALSTVVAPGDLEQASRFVAAVESVANPLPAAGGAPPETDRSIRANAPEAFHQQARCIVPADWEEVAGRIPGVRQAAAVLSWSGSWRTAMVHVQRVQGLPEDPRFLDEVAAALEPCRPAGQDLRVLPPDYVPLEVVVQVRLVPGALASAVERRIRQALTGPGGPFAPATMRFGEPVWQSRILAAVMAVAGVAWAAVRHLAPLDALEPGAPAVLPMGPTRIARLDDDPENPANGVIGIYLEE